jgi:ATP-dependent RNA helicase DDX24/MAK5
MVIPCRLSDLEHDPDEPTSRKGPKRKQGGGGPSANVANLKAELRERLAEPLMARGVSARYPTSGSKVIIDDLLAEKGKWIHPMLPCL